MDRKIPGIKIKLLLLFPRPNMSNSLGGTSIPTGNMRSTPHRPLHMRKRKGIRIYGGLACIKTFDYRLSCMMLCSYICRRLYSNSLVLWRRSWDLPIFRIREIKRLVVYDWDRKSISVRLRSLWDSFSAGHRIREFDLTRGLKLRGRTTGRSREGHLLNPSKPALLLVYLIL